MNKTSKKNKKAETQHETEHAFEEFEIWYTKYLKSQNLNKNSNETLRLEEQQ